MNKEDIYAFLNAKGIKYEITEHKAAFTMDDLADITLPYPDVMAKNLFVRDEKKRHYYLISVKGDKRVDLKIFQAHYGTKRLGFASEKDLLALMQLMPGSVTPLGLLTDTAKNIMFYLDKDLAADLIGCHPCDNTATVWLKTSDLLALIREHGNTVNVVDL